MDELVQFWADYRPPAKGRPCLHPRDAMELRDSWRKWGSAGDREDYLRTGCKEDSCFHFSLEPIPFIGNLEKADIVILMLNPGFALSEYYANAHPGYRKAMHRTMKQDFDRWQFPFFWLDPDFCWCDGFIYWERRLRKILKTRAAKKFNDNYRDALREASRRIALIELVPYCSVKFPQKQGIVDWPSAVAAKAAAERAARRAQDGRCAVVGRGGTDRWGELRPGQRVQIQDRGIRSFYLSPKDGLGRVLYEQLSRDGV